MDDTKIIDLYWSRSERAISETAEKYGTYCHSIAFRILHDHQDSEECVNDTWLGALEDLALAEALSRFLRSLPQEPQRFFVQRYWYVCSIREIADRCGASPGKVKMSLLRTRRSLRKFLREEGITV